MIEYTPVKMARVQEKKAKPLTILTAVKEVKEQEISFIANGNTNWYSHFRRHFDISL